MTIRTAGSTSLLDRFREFSEDYHLLFVLVGWVIGLLTIPALGILMDGHMNTIIDLLKDLLPEAFGIGFTVLILDRLNDQREIESEKQRLRREAGSRDNSTAISAIDWMRHEDWMAGEKGLLEEEDLSFAQLTGADFGKRANLRAVNFRETDLRGAYIGSADLRDIYALQVNLSDAFVMISDFTDAQMEQANLENTNFFKANLARANLQHANLKRTILGAANLRGANLNSADMNGAILVWQDNGVLVKTIIDSTTKLPDGSYYDPTRGLEQMMRFGCIISADNEVYKQRWANQ